MQRRIYAAVAVLTSVPAIALAQVVDVDQIGRKAFGTSVTGSVQWTQSQYNEDRGAYYAIRVRQDSTYKPYCLGVVIMYETVKGQNTYGGAVQGGWSFTGGFSAGGEISYSRTSNATRTSDGFYWKCPVGGGYVDYEVRGNVQVSRAMSGKFNRFAVQACMAEPGNLVNRWCTPWDLNSFGD